MGVLDNPFHITFSKQQVPSAVRKEQMFTLTNLGRQQVEQLDGAEPEFNLLATMVGRRAWSIDDLSKETHMDGGKVKYELKVLMKKGLVKTIGGEGE